MNHTATEPAAVPSHDRVVEDMSVTLLAGRVTSSEPALAQVVDAEQLGFKRAWIPERYNIKEAGVMLGAMAARTSRIGVGTGPMSISSRPPIVTASMGATVHSMFGPRCTLGVGRSIGAWIAGHGFGEVGYRALIDWVGIMKQLWRGETVDYDGPAGCYENLTMIDRYPGPPPEVVFFHLGGPKASVAAADPIFDGVALVNLTTAEVVRRSIETTKQEAERLGRDPESIHFIAPVTTAPDFSETDTRIMVAARVAIYIQLPVGRHIMKLNGWDEATANEIGNHPQFKEMAHGLVDHSFHRGDLLGPAMLVPERWMREAAAIGTAAECVEALQKYKDAGAHEIDLYGSTPAENAGLIRAWRAQTADLKETPR